MVKTLNIFRWVTVALMVVILALQFVPNWKVEEKNISISHYLWFPENEVEKEDGMTTSIEKMVASTVETEKGLQVDEIVNVAVCQLVGALVAFIMYLAKKRGAFAAIVPGVAGVGGVLGCLTKSVYQTGSLFLPILVVSAVALLVAAAMFVMGVINIVTEESY